MDPRVHRLLEFGNLLVAIAMFATALANIIFGQIGLVAAACVLAAWSTQNVLDLQRATRRDAASDDPGRRAPKDSDELEQ